MDITTFHRLCELLGSKAGTLPPRPTGTTQDWWDQTLPDALDAAIDADPDRRYHAVIIDEGQDFATGWLQSLGLLLLSQVDGVFWIFHDPAQALYRPDVTDRDGETVELEADHRRHAEIENTIRDLKYGMALNHLPSGRFAANGAWLAVHVMAHNVARWTSRIGLGAGIVTTKTLRRRLFDLPGRLTRSARRLTLHLPARWPWAIRWAAALTRLRAIPLLAWSGELPRRSRGPRCGMSGTASDRRPDSRERSWALITTPPRPSLAMRDPVSHLAGGESWHPGSQRTGVTPVRWTVNR